MIFKTGVCFSMLIFLLLSAGARAAANLPPGWPWHGVVLEGIATPDDIKRLAGYGANSVVILLSPRTWANRQNISAEQAWQFSLNYADTILDACKTYGVTGILSVSQIPVDPSLGLSQESREFWESPARLMEATAIARSLAQHFHNRGKELGAYEMLNEPLIREGEKVELPKVWPRLVLEIVNEIRRYDAQRFVALSLAIGGLPSGYGDTLRPIADSHIIYTAHMYMPYDYSHQGVGGWKKLNVEYPGTIDGKYWDQAAIGNFMSPLLLFQYRFDVPVWISEFSAIRWAPNSERYLSDLINTFNKNGWGWAYFSFKGFHGWDASCGTEFGLRQCVGEDSSRWQLLKRSFITIQKNDTTINGD